MKKLIVLGLMHISILCAITVFIYQHNIKGWDAVEFYLGYLPFWLVNYKVLETPQHRGGAIASCLLIIIGCLVSAFYFHAYFLIFTATAFCAICIPLVDQKQVTQ